MLSEVGPACRLVDCFLCYRLVKVKAVSNSCVGHALLCILWATGFARRFAIRCNFDTGKVAAENVKSVV
jgi:hypothetical protein